MVSIHAFRLYQLVLHYRNILAGKDTIRMYANRRNRLYSSTFIALYQFRGGNIIIDRIVFALFFLHIGNVYKNKLEIKERNGLLTLLVGIFIVCNIYIAIYDSHIVYFSGTLFCLPYGMMWLVALSGTFATVIFSKRLAHVAFLQYLGRNTLAIYAIHLSIIWHINKFIGTLGVQSISSKLLVAAAEYTVVFTLLFAILHVLTRYMPSRYLPYLGISK